jgi:YHS domain-containing protein
VACLAIAIPRQVVRWFIYGKQLPSSLVFQFPVSKGVRTMSYVTKLGPSFVCAILLSIVVGCGTKPAAQKPAPPAGTQAATNDSDEAEIEKNLASLSPEDRELAIKQRVCPVSGERLGVGTMGAPLKIEVKGKTVFICCESCKQPLLDEPDKYLAKLGLASDAPQGTK